MYRLDEIERGLADAQSGERQALSRSDRLLSHALVEYAADQHRPAPQNRITYIDPQLAPSPPAPAALLASASRSPAATLQAIARMHPLYEQLRAGLAWYRVRYGSLPQLTLPPGPNLAPGSKGDRVRLLRQRLGVPAASGDPARYDAALGSAVREFRKVHGLGDAAVADAETIAALNAGPAFYESVILTNLDRVRGLPAAPGRRYLLVDTAGARLSLYEGGQLRDTMRVIVGKPEMQTPQLAGLVRFAMLNPYWNIPPDLVRANIAPKVLAEGPGYLASREYEALSDWSESARVLRPDEIDWRAVANGALALRMRQRPGGDNMMGRIKFMFPNRFGIYLHDTPKKELFAEPDRHLSSGCIRLEDAARLGRWIFGHPVVVPAGSVATESRLDIPEPMPLYVIHLTARPEGGEIRFQKDVYGRDLAATTRWASARPAAQ